MSGATPETDSVDSFMAALKEVEREALAVIAAVGADAPITVPDRDYTGMTPKDCYEAGLMDGGMAVRQAIRDAIDAASPRRL